MTIPPSFCAAFDNRHQRAAGDNRRTHPPRPSPKPDCARVRGGYHEVLLRGAWSNTFVVSYFGEARNRHACPVFCVGNWRRSMSERMGRFMSEVQHELQNRGTSPSLSVDEEDLVNDYEEQQFSAKKCAERIIEQRAT
jgi:hypothetical protein